jgi:hypothetical protein
LNELVKSPVEQTANQSAHFLATTAVVSTEFTLNFIKYGIDRNVKWLIMDMPGNFSNFVEFCSVSGNVSDKPMPWPSNTCSLGMDERDQVFK